MTNAASEEKLCEHCGHKPARITNRLDDRDRRIPGRWCSNECKQKGWLREFRATYGYHYHTQYSRDRR